MTVSQAAKLLGVTRYRIHAMIRQGQLASEKRETDVGTPYLVLKKKQVEDLAEARRERAAGKRPLGMPGPRPNPPKEKE